MREYYARFCENLKLKCLGLFDDKPGKRLSNLITFIKFEKMMIFLNFKQLFLLSFILMTGLVTFNSCKNDYSLSPDRYAKIYIMHARNSSYVNSVIIGL